MIRAAALLALLAPAIGAAGEIELRHGEDALTNGNEGWRETALRVDGSSGVLGLGILGARTERFGWVDWGFAATAHARVAERWDLGVEGGGSATHHVAPAWLAGARAHYAIGGGLAAYGGLRWSRYEGDVVSTDVALGSVGVEYYAGAHRVALTAFVPRVEGTWSASAAAAWDLFYRGRDRLGVVVSAGRELESVGGGQVVATATFAFAAFGRTALGDGPWSLSYGAECQVMRDLYTRAGGRLGVVREF
jgi:YaiO family outer membrane protein